MNKRNLGLFVTAPLLLMMNAPSAYSFPTLEGSWYVGGSVGQSSLEPDGHELWSVTDDKDVSKKLYAGMNITRSIGVEAFWNDFGSATVKKGTQSDSIDYKAIGANVIYHAPINLGQLHPFGKLGVAKITTGSKGVAPVKQLNNTNIFTGIGAEYTMTRNLALRGEYEYFDKDIQQVSFGLQYSPNGDMHHLGVRPVVKAPLPAATPAVVRRAPAPKPRVIYRAPAPRVVKKAPKKPKYKVLSRTLSGGSHFASNSAQLNSVGLAALTNLARDIQRSGMKATNITIVGHTDNVGKAYSNQVLSMQRANNVATFLANSGIPRHLLKTFGRGESQPVATNHSSNGRAKNRRVEISVQGIEKVVVSN